MQPSGNFVTPAVAKAKNDWEIVQQETFAPILYLIPYDTLLIIFLFYKEEDCFIISKLIIIM